MRQVKQAVAVLGVALFALIGTVLMAGSASAHSTMVNGSVDCVDGTKTITWSVTNSENDKVMTVTASDNNTVPVGTTVGNGGTGHYTQKAYVTGDYSLDIATSWPDGVTSDPSASVVHVTDGCTPPPPVDVCDNLPGNQPTGTACSHEPVVTVTPVHEESCALGGAEDSTSTSTVNYVFNANTNTFDAQTPVTTRSDVVFTAWTADQLTANGCTPPPPVDVCDNLPGNQPTGTACSHEPVVTVTPVHEESCALGGAEDSTSTSTVNYVFNANTNTFDAQTPVTTKSDVVFTAWTADQLAAYGCTTVSPPTTPPVASPPVTVVPQAAPPTTTASVLPDTGADSNLVGLSALGLLCLAAGARTLRVSRKK